MNYILFILQSHSDLTIPEKPSMKDNKACPTLSSIKTSCGATGSHLSDLPYLNPSSQHAFLLSFLFRNQNYIDETLKIIHNLNKIGRQLLNDLFLYFHIPLAFHMPQSLLKRLVFLAAGQAMHYKICFEPRHVGIRPDKDMLYSFNKATILLFKFSFNLPRIEITRLKVYPKVHLKM